MANILLARQDRTMREYLAEQLTRYGHRVTVSDCFETMMAAVNDNGTDYDLLISDLGMGGRDGFNLVRELQLLAPDIRLVFMSGFSGIGVVQTRTWFHAHIVTQPFHIRELPEQVNVILSTGMAA